MHDKVTLRILLHAKFSVDSDKCLGSCCHFELRSYSGWAAAYLRMKLIVAFSLEEVYTFEFVLPALVVASNAARDIWLQLYHHEWTAPLMRCVDELVARQESR